jgi:hypothetical protein
MNTTSITHQLHSNYAPNRIADCQSAYLSPGEQTGEQIAFLIPNNSAPGQVHVDFPRTPVTIELKTWPIPS